MPPPDFRAARIDHAKIADYLLGGASFAAIAKARFFGRVGFRVKEWQRFAQALRTQAAGAAVAEERSPWGRKYVALGPIDAPNGRRYKVVSVWIDDGTGLRLVTAYPAKD
jgi:hypothetical protein